MPVGCLIEHLNAEALVETIKEIVTYKDVGLGGNAVKFGADTQVCPYQIPSV